MEHSRELVPADKVGGFGSLKRFFRDPEASTFKKLTFVLGVLYVVWPVDFIPEAFGLIGVVDDLTALRLMYGTYRDAKRTYSAQESRRKNS